MLGALLCGVVGYKIGKHNSNNNDRRYTDEETDELYKAQLKCVAQCSALRAAADAGANARQIVDMYNQMRDDDD